LGATAAPEYTRADENYWLLIGQSGVVELDDDSALGIPGGPRVLVKFDGDVRGFGLQCHNEVPNALWLLTSDLSAEA